MTVSPHARRRFIDTNNQKTPLAAHGRSAEKPDVVAPAGGGEMNLLAAARHAVAALGLRWVRSRPPHSVHGAVLNPARQQFNLGRPGRPLCGAAVSWGFLPPRPFRGSPHRRSTCCGPPRDADAGAGRP